jgi:hypothetical protein
MAASLLAGWLLALSAELPEATVGLATGFLGGAVVLNVLKEELPEERDSRLGAFLLGAGASALPLLA